VRKVFFSGVMKINKFISQTKAKLVLFMTWVEKPLPKNHEIMSSAYRNVSKKINSILAPVGDYWHKVVNKYPEFELYREDGEHASEIGSLLISNVLYHSIFDKTQETIDIKQYLMSCK